MIKIIQRFGDFTTRLDAIRKEWRATAIIHNDIRADNCLLLTPLMRTELKLLDWELAGIGDPCWDVGSVFADMLGTWVHSLPIADEITAEYAIALATFPLDRMHPAILSFWQTYTQWMNIKGGTREEWLLRAICFMAVR